MWKISLWLLCRLENLWTRKPTPQDYNLGSEKLSCPLFPLRYEAQDLSSQDLLGNSGWIWMNRRNTSDCSMRSRAFKPKAESEQRNEAGGGHGIPLPPIQTCPHAAELFHVSGIESWLQRRAQNSKHSSITGPVKMTAMTPQCPCLFFSSVRRAQDSSDNGAHSGRVLTLQSKSAGSTDTANLLLLGYTPYELTQISYQVLKGH